MAVLHRDHAIRKISDKKNKQNMGNYQDIQSKDRLWQCDMRYLVSSVCLSWSCVWVLQSKILLPRSIHVPLKKFMQLKSDWTLKGCFN
jgi:hypothetical protein